MIYDITWGDGKVAVSGRKLLADRKVKVVRVGPTWVAFEVEKMDDALLSDLAAFGFVANRVEKKGAKI